MTIKCDRDVDKYYVGVICIAIVAWIVMYGNSAIAVISNMSNLNFFFFCIIAAVVLSFCVWYGLQIIKDRSRKYVLSEKGCEIYGWRGYYKFFSWEEADSKYIVHAKKGDDRGWLKGVAALDHWCLTPLNSRKR